MRRAKEPTFTPSTPRTTAATPTTSTPAQAITSSTGASKTSPEEAIPSGSGITTPNNKIDLKTPSFIPVEPSDDVDPEPHAEDIEPDSLDPNINNEVGPPKEQTPPNEQPPTNSEEASEEVPPEVPPHKDAGAAAIAGAAPKKLRSRHRHKKHTHNEKRYHSEVRQEAVQQALAAMNKSKAVPMPSKRSSVMKTSAQNGDSDEDDEGDDSSSGSEDDAAEVSASGANGGDHQDLQVRNVTLGMSDTSSNNSLARGGAIASTSFSETPPLPSRNVGAAPPSRPPVTSPSRQNSR